MTAADKGHPKTGLPIPGLRISGYRTLHDVEVAPSGQVTIICGPNNSGKSSLLAALQAFPALVRQLQARKQVASEVLQGFAEGSVAIAVDLASPEIAEASGTADWREQLRQFEEILGDHHIWLNFIVKDGKATFDPSGIDQFATQLHAWLRGTPEQRGWAATLFRLGGQSALNDANQRTQWVFQMAGNFLTVPDIRRVSDVRRLAEQPLSEQDLRGLVVAAQPNTQQLKRTEWARTLEQVLQDVFGDDVRYAASVTEGDDELLLAVDGQTDVPAEQVGAGIREVLAIAFRALQQGGAHVLAIEEPENCLHPAAVRKLIRSLAERVGLQLFVSTHSAAVINSQPDTVVELQRSDAITSSWSVNDAGSRFRAVRALGHAPSDLVLTPCAVWVEGPSDRIFLTNWLSDENLVEGIHYQMAFFGGALGTHYSTAHTRDAAEFYIEMRQLTRRCAFVVDSDRKTIANAALKPYVKRWRRETRDDPDADVFITWGREIENSLPLGVINAVRARHKKPRIGEGTRRFGNVLQGLRVPKVKFALEAVEAGASTPPDAEELVKQLARFIQDSQEGAA